MIYHSSLSCSYFQGPITAAILPSRGKSLDDIRKPTKAVASTHEKRRWTPDNGCLNSESVKLSKAAVAAGIEIRSQTMLLQRILPLALIG